MNLALRAKRRRRAGGNNSPQPGGGQARRQGDSQDSPRRRNGLILAATLAVLVIVILFAAGLTRALMLHHRQERQWEQRQQALWLADSALARATRTLAQDAQYSGEIWRVTGEQLGTGHAGVATIRVVEASEPRRGRQVRVEVHYPDEGLQRFSFERETLVEPSRPGGSL